MSKASEGFSLSDADIQRTYVINEKEKNFTATTIINVATAY